jgi:DNA polymerase theta
LLVQVVRIHRRFYAALILADLINEVPFSDVTAKYATTIESKGWTTMSVLRFVVRFGVVRGSLQSLQQTASTFAGMVHVFCQKLGWYVVFQAGLAALTRRLTSLLP